MIGINDNKFAILEKVTEFTLLTTLISLKIPNFILGKLCILKMARSNLEFSKMTSVWSASVKSQTLKAPFRKLAPLICAFDKLQPAQETSAAI